MSYLEPGSDSDILLDMMADKASIAPPITGRLESSALPSRTLSWRLSATDALKRLQF